ncbi:SigB/SigF/SigG family RNA polymerase sigma factor [Cryptosporangium arvum]|uniref:RNA polymerase sigma-70 factor, sigma-B/F/G subfamily n=1 Tax=Cryptosporangium arvum DSM 44712 TaxID=927661 RepID=A0A010ZUD2_9ACTN|nr:SigB/SigF/SigG family RNA polymerase sigma factor [Cryptosporangium arvum]EXG82274.1 RNA polymerase sigma-70 factor, sigma-B/F/G subfamily [Cryptosporangium arvum DSM 44712]
MTTTPAEETADYAVYADVEPLFRRYAGLASDTDERRALRTRLVVIHLPIADHISRRYDRRGVPLEDLTQVARLGLVRAIDRFDPALGFAFLSYAVPTVLGEVRRHFRDAGWYVRPPRRLHDLHLRINTAISDLTARDNRAPNATAIAGYLGASPGDVAEALALTHAYRPISLDAHPGGAPEGELLGVDDPALATVVNHEALRVALARLPERERSIVGMRFFQDLTQSQIAARVGCSQMHVSRLLTQTLGRLRLQLLADG